MGVCKFGSAIEWIDQSPTDKHLHIPGTALAATRETSMIQHRRRVERSIDISTYHRFHTSSMYTNQSDPNSPISTYLTVEQK